MGNRIRMWRKQMGRTEEMNGNRGGYQCKRRKKIIGMMESFKENEGLTSVKAGSPQWSTDWGLLAAKPLRLINIKVMRK